jgi:F-type H+-transporting ATPase subunit b
MDNPLVQPDPGLFIWTLLTFLVMLVLLGRYAWRPMLAALDRRRQMVEKTVDDAKRATEALERAQQENAKILAAARVEAEAIVSRSRAAAEKLRTEMREQAMADAAAIQRNAERQIQLETNRALEQIRHEAVDLSLAIASRILRRTVSREDNEALIADAISHIGSTQH